MFRGTTCSVMLSTSRGGIPEGLSRLPPHAENFMKVKSSSQVKCCFAIAHCEERLRTGKPERPFWFAEGVRKASIQHAIRTELEFD
jgi:hypothetical protein